ncbi:PadR family transcriptional regulator [Paenibacillus timonensis]|uniref:PadR family transcriptional regulator n=1 Tax=Paenibacillus timonensis TaxID=225915 RepID=A0ABW3SGX6_9BACL|nr:PadR family transcriptional regulator [Paenibacillus timonensis]MCH1642433.1 PadR family transcriptional regulator [Paenibacillus timonensis]
MKALAIRLCILGLLLEEDQHPYEMLIRIRDRFLDQHGNFKAGSLYYAVDQLAKEAYIEAVETIQTGGRPDKTVYRITDKGREYFHKLLIDRFQEEVSGYHPLHVALVFARHGERDKVADLLRDRIREAEHQVNLSYQVYEEHRGIVPRSVLHLMAGRYEHARTELSWLRRLFADAEAGRLGDRDPADLLIEEE